MPQISMTMTDGTIVKWLKAVGDAVVEGEALVEIQTDKAVDELGAAASGVIRSIAAPEGEIVLVGDVICTIAADGEAEAAAGGDAAAPAPADAPPVASAAAAAPAPADAAADGRTRASPLAKRIAAQQGIDLSAVSGTGPNGMIVKADVEDAATRRAASPAGPAPSDRAASRAAPPPVAVEADDTVVPFEGIRRAIADNLMLSKRSAAEVTTVADVDMGAVKAMRAVLPVSYTVFCVLAAAKALQDYPVMNALVEDDRVVLKKRINVCVAVATAMGLLTPVIPDAGRKNLLTIAEDLADLSERGRAGKLGARDFEGGTFTVTNSGVFGSVLFTPIINHPQSAVLGLGRIAPTPVVRGDAIVPALMMYLSLTYNHRSIDGETAVKFLQQVRHYLEHPDDMLGLKTK
ncbi:dihydrolipoamide acetyltransferase family protein [Rhodoplanes sp. TEM]|uniref:Dihydrolipoamide acetyltransferase component of pyruvate dehydrogenase complex n=1 Tax=Rhodoplanes tepidamans TaxID=200616 RepID=A0ABT5JHJ8_RHOTP|nr:MULTISPECIES: dihydrolipoamide acetyltransferase family protein [Rhodoplanes]MDC7788883.1 dihydrolipoamide acetyltransferase family protein [Rhodoplanes tepidamans]MDC7987508.1 dihydrolipoamide acetyltransferase family protein [Rhodoplanes sp. TEM]MDQ0355119.1 pyruvate/2-oxoglutarate dehydrogenase complex dihydrolipoamide acyltransferase (E2) component [Rhodoplanes tepidamans]